MLHLLLGLRPNNASNITTTCAAAQHIMLHYYWGCAPIMLVNITTHYGPAGP